MTFEEATDQMFAAIHARDLSQLGRALHARAAAIEAGVTPTSEIIEKGERALRALTALRKDLGFEYSRVRRFQTAVASTFTPQPNPRVDYEG